MKKCPYCAEEIQEEAIKCRFCGRDLAGQPPTDNKWQLFAERFKAADPATQRRLWADLTEDQRRYLQTNFRLSGSSVQSPPGSVLTRPVSATAAVGGVLVFVAYLYWVCSLSNSWESDRPSSTSAQKTPVATEEARQPNPNELDDKSGTRKVGKWTRSSSRCRWMTKAEC